MHCKTNTNRLKLKIMSTFVTKQSKAISLFKSGNMKEAFAIFKTFRLGFTKEEQKTITIASECFTPSYRKFYEQLGKDTEAIQKQAVFIISAKYCI